MIMAVTSLGETIDSPVDQRFGRARYFIIFDTETEEWSPQRNSRNATAVQGGGIQAAHTIAGRGVEAVLTGHCGPKAFAALAAGGISVFSGVRGTVREAISDYRAGRLTESDVADAAAGDEQKMNTHEA